jgi:hypothetical protein
MRRPWRAPRNGEVTNARRGLQGRDDRLAGVARLLHDVPCNRVGMTPTAGARHSARSTPYARDITPKARAPSPDIAEHPWTSRSTLESPTRERARASARHPDRLRGSRAGRLPCLIGGRDDRPRRSGPARRGGSARRAPLAGGVARPSRWWSSAPPGHQRSSTTRWAVSRNGARSGAHATARVARVSAPPSPDAVWRPLSRRGLRPWGSRSHPARRPSGPAATR